MAKQVFQVHIWLFDFLKKMQIMEVIRKLERFLYGNSLKKYKSPLMICNTVMPRSQILLFAGHLCAHNRYFLSKLFCSLKSQQLFFIKRGNGKGLQTNKRYEEYRLRALLYLLSLHKRHRTFNEINRYAATTRIRVFWQNKVDFGIHCCKVSLRISTLLSRKRTREFAHALDLQGFPLLKCYLRSLLSQQLQLAFLQNNIWDQFPLGNTAVLVWTTVHQFVSFCPPKISLKDQIFPDVLQAMKYMSSDSCS